MEGKDEILKKISVVLEMVNKHSQGYYGESQFALDYKKQFTDHRVRPKSITPVENIMTIFSLTFQTILSYSPPNSPYIEMINGIRENIDFSKLDSIQLGVKQLNGILLGLYSAYLMDLFRDVKEIIRAEVFSDTLEQAAYLNKEGFKDAAANLAGGVLEQHLKALCQKNNIPLSETLGNGKIRIKKSDSLNAELLKNKIISMVEHKHITAWLEIRNDAAHGYFDKYTHSDVDRFQAGLRDLIDKHPA